MPLTTNLDKPMQPQSFESVIINYLVSKGMFKSQAQVVLELVKQDPANHSMSGRWEDCAAGYPATISATMKLSAEKHALTWIDENLPSAWFRPMFTGNIPN